MRRSLILPAVLLLAAAPLAAVTEPSAEEREQNQWLLGKIRTDPERYQHLLRDLRSFNRLPAEQQERLRRLEHAIQEEPSATQVRLRHAAARYTAWLRELPPDERARVTAETDPDRRLALIKEIRRRQWLEQLPSARRDRVRQAAGAARDDLIRQYRAEEYRHRRDWRLALRHWNDLSDPRKRSQFHRLEDFPPAVRNFFSDYLQPILSPADRKRLDEASGTGLFPFILLELADTNPVLLPGPTTGLSYIKDLPREVWVPLQAKLEPAWLLRLREAEGRWPDFAVAVAEAAQAKKVSLPRPLGPVRPAELPASWQSVVQQLQPVLDKDERQRLAGAAGKWPLFPKTLYALAVRHHIATPPDGARLGLPGPSQRWERFRDRTNDEVSLVSDEVLREFARTELTPDQRVHLGATLADPWSRGRLQEAYVAEHKEEWLKLQLSDHQKRARKQAAP